MKLESIKKEHIIEAAHIIDSDGIPDNYISNNYYLKLENGNEYPFKHITRLAYKLVDGNNDIQLDFESNKRYRDYIESLGFEMKYFHENFNFFSPQEIIHFSKIAGRAYRKDDEEALKNGQLLRPMIRKVNMWARNSIIEDLVYKEDNHWQWSGTFKSYIWIRIYRKSSSKKIFFIVGVNQHREIYIQLNCLRSNHTAGRAEPLNEEQIAIFDKYLEDINYEDFNKNISELNAWNWQSLFEVTQSFISNYLPIYDELEDLIKLDFKTEKENYIEETLPPKKIKSYTQYTRNFEGKNSNWNRKNQVSEQLGKAGEELVIICEKEKLKKLELFDEADKVHKKKDGEGFDILSFDENKNEIYIEVKTTTSNIDEPFYMSLNEKCYLEEKSENYYLYRLYNFNKIKNSAKVYKLNFKDLNKLVFNPINFEVIIKE